MADLIKVRDYASGEHVRGLRELQRELRRADPELAKRLQQVNKRLVMDVAREAQAAAYRRVDDVATPIRTGPERRRPSGRGSISASVRSIRGTASGREARVVGGGSRAPAFFGHEFGGSRGLGGVRGQRNATRNRTRQFPVHRGREGYFLYPTVRRRLVTAGQDWQGIFNELFPEDGGA